MHAEGGSVKRYDTPKKLRKAESGHYWILLAGYDWDVGYLSNEQHEVLFCFTPPEGYFGGGRFGLTHEVLEGATFVGPIPEPQ